jgi:hypothetical protein
MVDELRLMDCGNRDGLLQAGDPSPVGDELQARWN